MATPFNRDQMQARAAELAAGGIYLGTSSWKYEGWLGQLYSADRYQYRDKLAKTRFERDCLREYAEVFKTVCVDAAYYTFPSRQYLERLTLHTPDDFLFAFKVTDTITIKKFPKLDRFGDQAGKANHAVPQRRPVREGVPSTLRDDSPAGGLADVRVFPLLAQRLRARPRLPRRPGPVPGPTARRLALRRRTAEPELAWTGVLRLPCPPRRRARVQLVGSDAVGRASKWPCRVVVPIRRWWPPASC